MLSSYELLELVFEMPDRGRFKTAVRNGEWSEEESMWAHMANEMAKLRATMHVVHGGKEAAYSPKVFLSAAERLEMVEREEAVEEARESVFDFADFTGKIEPQRKDVEELDEWDIELN